MQYFHRTHLAPAEAIEEATRFFGPRLALTEEQPRRRGFAGRLGHLTVTAAPEGGHYTLVTVKTDQVGESELDKLAKRFLTLLHAHADPGHRPIGAY